MSGRGRLTNKDDTRHTEDTEKLCKKVRCGDRDKGERKKKKKKGKENELVN